MLNCTHVDMAQVRTAHIHLINVRVKRQVATMSEDQVDEAAVRLHKILVQLQNYALRRIHLHHHVALAHLPTQLTIQQLLKLYVYWKEYVAMALDLYSTRQYLVSIMPKERSKSFTPRPFYHQGVLRAREVLEGNSIKCTWLDSAQHYVLEANLRGRLGSHNCVLLRPLVKSGRSMFIVTGVTP